MAKHPAVSNSERLEAVEQLRAFLDDKIEPIVTLYRDRFIPKETMLSIARQLVDFGLVTAPFPVSVGGWGLDWETHMRLFEEVCYTSSDLGLAISINAIGGNLLFQRAPEHIKKRYLPQVLAGQALLSVCISEPGVGSDVSSVSVRAELDGDHYIINGEKTWITNGEYSDFLVVTARTRRGSSEGLTHIFVDRAEHGYEARPIKKIALNSQSTAQVFFNNTRVPVTNRIGDEGRALPQTLKIFEIARLIMAFWAVGLARRSLDEAVRYALERRQHGKVIAGHQLIAGRLAEMATSVHAARALALEAVRLIQAGQRADKEVSMAKWYACEMVGDVTRSAVHIHGGNGVTTDFLVEKLAREAMVLPIPDGTSEVQKLLIARALTGVSAFR
jgi:alkylation response protein AidB-like acyl-CoA dehydrogenase